MSKDTDFPVHMTDLGNSVRLIRAHGDNICYCYQTSKWHIWDSRRWAIDTRGRIEDMAKDTVLRIFHELPYIESSTDRAALAKHATISESNGRIKAMISLARSARPVELEKLDRKPWLLNVNNGTLNLKIGKLEPHSKEDYLNKCIHLDYYLISFL